MLQKPGELGAYYKLEAGEQWKLQNQIEYVLC